MQSTEAVGVGISDITGSTSALVVATEMVLATGTEEVLAIGTDVVCAIGPVGVLHEQIHEDSSPNCEFLKNIKNILWN